MDVQLRVRLDDRRPAYEPGDELAGEYEVQADSPADVTAVEVSVLWYTEGKGDEDLGVHFFERRTLNDHATRDLRGGCRFATQLPKSPLSYRGVIVKIRWCVRVRLFVAKARPISREVPFVLGGVPPAIPVVTERSHATS